MSPGAAVGPNMGHNTPTKVLAWAGEQTKEQHNAIAVASFFTPHLPHHRPLPTRYACRCRRRFAGRRRKSVITPTPVIYTKSHQLPAANCGIYAKQTGDIAVAWAGAQRFRAVGAVSWPAPRFPPPPVGPTVQIGDRSGQVKR